MALYVAIVKTTADLRLCPLNATSLSAFFASSFKKRTELTLPFFVILYSTLGLISIVTLPASISQPVNTKTRQIQINKIMYDANVINPLDLTFFLFKSIGAKVITFSFSPI